MILQQSDTDGRAALLFTGKEVDSLLLTLTRYMVDVHRDLRERGVEIDDEWLDNVRLVGAAASTFADYCIDATSAAQVPPPGSLQPCCDIGTVPVAGPHEPSRVPHRANMRARRTSLTVLGKPSRLLALCRDDARKPAPLPS